MRDIYVHAHGGDDSGRVTQSASVAPTATPNDWSSLTAVALDIGLAGVSAGLRGTAAACVPTEAASSTAIGDT